MTQHDPTPLVEPEPEATEGIPAPTGAANLIDTDYVIGQDNITTSRFGFPVDLHGKVFMVSAVVITAFVLITLAFRESVSPIFDAVFDWVIHRTDWFFLLSANIFVLLAVVLIFTPWRRSGSVARTRSRTSSAAAGSRCCSPPAWASASCTTGSRSR